MVKMSFRNQALRDLVAERLAVAADEIFALFERTFAEYEEEFLRTKLQQEPREEPKEDVQALLVQTDVDPGLEHIKYEEKEMPLEVQFPSIAVKYEDNANKCIFLQQEPAEENRRDPVGEQFEGEEPGCSLDLNIKEYEPCSYSDTDDSDNWEPLNKMKRNPDGQTDTFNHMNFGKDSLSEHSQHHQEFSEESVSFQREQLPTCSHNEDAFNDGKDKPFSCAVCSKSFPQKRILKAHMRIHTGEKPYICKTCGLSFRFQQNYFQHDLAVHRKEKPYRCRVCKKDFAHKIEMITHRKTHDTKSFSCSKCSKVFNCVRYLRRHMERCPRKKRRQGAAQIEDGDLQMPFSSQSATQQDGLGFDSRIMLNASVNDWL